jgi:hypothetical protein
LYTNLAKKLAGTTDFLAARVEGKTGRDGETLGFEWGLKVFNGGHLRLKYKDEFNEEYK